jgi:hypothetical protein
MERVTTETHAIDGLPVIRRVWKVGGGRSYVRYRHNWLGAPATVWVDKHGNRRGKLHQLCGARCRDGHACRARSLPGRRRCRMHGSSQGPTSEAGRAAARRLLTGPKTADGRARGNAAGARNLVGPKTLKGRARAFLNLKQFRGPSGMNRYHTCPDVQKPCRGAAAGESE